MYAFTSIAFREVFNLFDINGGGTIDADELDAALKTVDINLTYKEIQDVLHVIDEDGKSSLYIYSQPLSFQNVSQVLALLLACFQLNKDAEGNKPVVNLLPLSYRKWRN